MLTPEIIVGGFTEIAILFTLLTCVPAAIFFILQAVDNYKWNKAFNKEMERLRLEGLERLQIPVVKDW